MPSPLSCSFSFTASAESAAPMRAPFTPPAGPTSTHTGSRTLRLPRSVLVPSSHATSSVLGVIDGPRVNSPVGASSPIFFMVLPSTGGFEQAHAARHAQERAMTASSEALIARSLSGRVVEFLLVGRRVDVVPHVELAGEVAALGPDLLGVDRLVGLLLVERLLDVLLAL